MRPEKPGPVSCSANANESKPKRRKQGRKQTSRNRQGGNRGASKRVCRGAEYKAVERQEGIPGKGWGSMAARKPNRANRLEGCRVLPPRVGGKPVGARWSLRAKGIRGRGHLFPHNPCPPTSHSQKTSYQPPPPPIVLGMQTHSTRHTQKTAAAPHTASHTPKMGVRRKRARRAQHARQPRGRTYGQEEPSAK